MAGEDSSINFRVRPPPGDFFVVGIGASAGGVGALREFFSPVRPDSGMAYVVIMHLSPQHESNISSVLQNHCSIPVSEVTQTVQVEPASARFRRGAASSRLR
jgi:chemotaxis response regulator CheB